MITKHKVFSYAKISHTTSFLKHLLDGTEHNIRLNKNDRQMIQGVVDLLEELALKLHQEKRELAKAARLVCTGYIENDHLLHDGDTCPIHEIDSFEKELF